MTRSLEPRPQEIAALLAAPAAKRFEYFIHKVADWGEAWGLRYSDDTWVSFGGAEHAVIFPLWPARAYAALAVEGDWAATTPTAIPLRALVEERAPAWQATGTPVGVFWVPTGQGVVVSAATLRDTLIEHCEEWGYEFD